MATLAELNIIIGAKIDEFESAMAEVEQGIGRAGKAAQAAGEQLTKYVTLPLTLLATASLKAAGDIQALEKGFAATYKGSEDLGTALGKVQELAKLPGLGLKEALQGATNLQAAGLSADLARRSLGAFGNALATVGRGKADLDGVGLALGQIAAKGKISAEEINQLAERVPQIREAMKAAFGTADTEALNKAGISATRFIDGVVTELEKLPKVTGGINNAFENLSDAVTIALSKVGSAINKTFDVEGVLNRLGDTLSGLADSFANLDPSTQKLIFGLAGLAAAAGPVIAVIGAVGAAAPAIAAGFTLLTGPVGLAAAAIAALTVGTVAYLASQKTLKQTFDEQQDKVQGLQQSLVPLLDRYDQLQGKVNLNASEQEDLRKIIQQVGEQVPEAITAFDQYGKALVINADAAREFVDRQKAALRAAQGPLIAEQEKIYAALIQQKNALDKQLFEGTKTIKPEAALVSGPFLDKTPITVKLTADEIRNLQQRFEEVNKKIFETDSYLRSLRGELTDTGKDATNAAGGVAKAVGLLAQLQEQLKAAQAKQTAATDTKQLAAANAEIEQTKLRIARLEELGTVSVKVAEAARLLRKELSQAAALSGVLATPAEGAKLTEEKISLLQSGLRKLIDLGANPASKAVQQLSQELLRLQQSLVPKAEKLTVPVVPEVRIDRTFGDKFGAEAAKLLGGYASQPIGVPVRLDYVVPTQSDQLKNILDTNITLAASFSNISKQASVFGGNIAGLSPKLQQAQTDATTLAQKAEALKGELQRMIKEGVDPALPGFQKLQQEYANTAAAADFAQRQINTSLQAAAAGADVVKGAIVDSIAGIAGVLGDALAGQVQDPAKALVAALLGPLGGMLIDLGKIAIASAIGVEGIKKALQSLNGPAALAAGVALIALGTAVKGAVSRLATPSAGAAGGSPVPTSTYQPPRAQTPTTAPGGASQPATVTHIFKLEFDGRQLKAVQQYQAEADFRTTGRRGVTARRN